MFGIGLWELVGTAVVIALVIAAFILVSRR
jgi:hypothetical protein